MLLSDQQIWNIAHRNRDKLFLESYERGEEIPVSGGEIWQVYRGVIQLNTVKLNQEETIVGWVTPNHVFGNLFEQDTRYRPVALADVYVRRFGIKEIQQSPNLTRVLLSEFSYRSLQSQRLLAINALRRVEERLWELLLMLAEEMGPGSPRRRSSLRGSEPSRARPPRIRASPWPSRCSGRRRGRCRRRPR